MEALIHSSVTSSGTIPAKPSLTSSELVKLGLDGLIPDEVTDGRIRVAIEKREGFGLLVGSAVTSALFSGDALGKIKGIC